MRLDPLQRQRDIHVSGTALDDARQLIGHESADPPAAYEKPLMDENPERLAQRGSAPPQNCGEFLLPRDAAAAGEGARRDLLTQRLDDAVNDIGPLARLPQPHCHFGPDHCHSPLREVKPLWARLKPQRSDLQSNVVDSTSSLDA